MHTREEVNTRREVAAVQIPDGNSVLLPEGTRLFITQELGGNFTVMTERGAMYRIDQRNGDALGREVVRPKIEETVAADLDTIEQLVWTQMRQCYDPEIPVNIVDLGLVYNCEVVESDSGKYRVDIKMTLTAPGCGMGPVLAEDVNSRVGEVPGVDKIDVEVVFDPPWNQNMMSEAARLQLGFF